MKRSFVPYYLVFLALAVFAANSTGQTQTIIKGRTAHGTDAWSGDDLYREFCAVCHGIDGKGAGPAAAALKTTPTDLTQITRRSGGKYPDLKIRAILKGDEEIVAHGTTEMPVWGEILKSVSANGTFGQMRVDALVKYLQTIQR